MSEEDGRFLRVMVASSGATRALEIGGANGYSAIWIGLGLRQTGGHLTTIEYDPARAKTAAENIRRAGLARCRAPSSRATRSRRFRRSRATSTSSFSTRGNATTSASSTWCFHDFGLRGLFLAHNVVNKQSEMPDFLGAIQNNPAVMTTIVRPSGEGMSVSVKLK